MNKRKLSICIRSIIFLEKINNDGVFLNSIDEFASILEKDEGNPDELKKYFDKRKALLSGINIAEDLKRQKDDQLIRLAKEIKDDQLEKIKDNKENKLFKLGQAIVGAVKMERIPGDIPDDKWNEQPYYIGYTNDIICSYACGVISGSSAEKNLVKLAENLVKNENGKKYISKLTDIIRENEDICSSFIPFEVGVTPPTNSSGVSYGFPDCVETTMRQLFSLLFCRGDSELAIERIPLRKFFEGRNIRDVANSGEMKIRNDWANTVCNGHEDRRISYKSSEHGGYELIADWKNMIKLFCYLMEGYEAEDDKEECGEEAKNRKKKAAERIAEINKKGLNNKDKDQLINILNDLLGIRGDVELICSDDSNKIREVAEGLIGTITIYPKDITKRDNNEVDVEVQSHHAFVHKIMGRRFHRIKDIESLKKLVKLIFAADAEVLEFLKKYLSENKSEQKPDWIDFISAVGKSKDNIENIDAVISALMKILNGKILGINKKEDITQDNGKICGTLEFVLQDGAKFEIFLGNKDKEILENSGFNYIGDLYYNHGFDFFNKTDPNYLNDNEIKLKASMYPVIDFFAAIKKCP